MEEIRTSRGVQFDEEELQKLAIAMDSSKAAQVTEKHSDKTLTIAIVSVIAVMILIVALCFIFTRG